jgi:hypothetical protein
MQEYRYSTRGRVVVLITHFFELFGVRRPVRYEPVPIEAGDYDHAMHSDQPEAPSLLQPYLDQTQEPKLGGAPKETAPGEDQQE